MSLRSINVIRVAAPKKATASVIFLHGLGDSGDGWSFLPTEVYRRASLQHINFILPSAPVRPITAFGQSAPAWFDVSSFGPGASQDIEGTLKSLAVVKQLVDAEIEKGIPADRIVVGGFSQGSALTIGTAATLDKTLAGFIAISGFIPVIKALLERETKANINTPILMLHGLQDEVVPVKSGQTSRDILKAKFGFTNVQWHEYDGLAHSVSPEGLNEVLDFLSTVLPNKD